MGATAGLLLRRRPVEAVDQRLDDELDRYLVDGLDVVRVPVAERRLDRLEERAADFLRSNSNSR